MSDLVRLVVRRLYHQALDEAPDTPAGRRVVREAGLLHSRVVAREPIRWERVEQISRLLDIAVGAPAPDPEDPFSNE